MIKHQSTKTSSMNKLVFKVEVKSLQFIFCAHIFERMCLITILNKSQTKDNQIKIPVMRALIIVI